jgi:hypothetical protein
MNLNFIVIQPVYLLINERLVFKGQLKQDLLKRFNKWMAKSRRRYYLGKLIDSMMRSFEHGNDNQSL